MTKKLTWIGIALFLTACAGGDDDDGMADESSGSVGETSTTAGMTDGMTSTMTTAPTTAETLSTTEPSTTDPSTTDDTTTDPTGEDSSTGEPAELTCEEYCAVYSASCVDHSEYANDQDCLDNCAQWPIGAAADTAVDTLGCRLYHATVAGSTDPETHCPHAGPSGAATCVAAEAPDCTLYCSRYFENCTGDLNAFADEGECMTECSNWYAGTFKDTEGHTIGCHTYHAMAAAQDAETHCPHAGPGGGGICVL